jgi:hypothetical protein
MIPEELYKRRHYGTPVLLTLLIANAVVLFLIVPAFVSCRGISWAFWVGFAGLATYNFFTIRRNREEFNKITIIAYAISIATFVCIFTYYAVSNC